MRTQAPAFAADAHVVPLGWVGGVVLRGKPGFRCVRLPLAKPSADDLMLDALQAVFQSRAVEMPVALVPVAVAPTMLRLLLGGSDMRLCLS